MAVPYLLYKNESAGSPSVYCRVQIHQTLEFDRLCRKVAPMLGMHPGTIRTAVNAVLDEAERHCHEGYRVEIGDRRLSLYPQVKHSVRATVDSETGEILWPRSEDVVPRGDDGRLECEVHKSWNRQFRRHVHWERARHDYRPFKRRKRK